MVPRQRLHPVPWAQFATNANSATTATNADTATTLVPNASINNNVYIDNGSNLFLRNSAQNSLWGIQVDSAGVLGFKGYNTGNFRLTLNQNGNVQVPGDFYTRKVVFDTGSSITSNGFSIQVNGDVNSDGTIRAALGFNGRCLNPGRILIRVLVTKTSPKHLAPMNARNRAIWLFSFLKTAISRPSSSPRKPTRRTIVGVVSTDPGLVFDQGETHLAGDNSNLITDEKTVVAMVGRVPTKFSLENGPIAVGDPLTSFQHARYGHEATEAGQIIG